MDRSQSGWSSSSTSSKSTDSHPFSHSGLRARARLDRRFTTPERSIGDAEWFLPPRQRRSSIEPCARPCGLRGPVYPRATNSDETEPGWSTQRSCPNAAHDHAHPALAARRRTDRRHVAVVPGLPGRVGAILERRISGRLIVQRRPGARTGRVTNAADLARPPRTPPRRTATTRPPGQPARNLEPRAITRSRPANLVLKRARRPPKARRSPTNSSPASWRRGTAISPGSRNAATCGCW